MAATIYTQWHDGTLVVRLSRPPVNALTLAMLAELRIAFEMLAAQNPRGLVLAGDGSAFCGGLDVKEVPRYSKEQGAQMIDEINAMITLLYGFPTATVAAVGGHAIGAGLVLVLACDVRLGVPDDTVKLGLTEVTAGISYPDCPMEVVNAEIEPSHRRHLVLSGEVVSPHGARARGLLDDLVPSDELLPTAVELARARGTAAAYRQVKAQLRATTLDRMHNIVANPEVRSSL